MPAEDTLAAVTAPSASVAWAASAPEVKAGQERALLSAIERGTLGRGSVAEGEYLRNMSEARQVAGDDVRLG